MKILVLGGNRFVGKRVVDRLSGEAHELRVVNRGSRAAPDRRGDRRDADFLKRAVGEKRWDVVYDFCCYQPDEALAAATLFKGRVGKYVLISSQSVYDAGPDLDESLVDPLRMRASRSSARSMPLIFWFGPRVPKFQGRSMPRRRIRSFSVS